MSLYRIDLSAVLSKYIGETEKNLTRSRHIGEVWKYVSVRRATLFFEESVDRGTQWAVFEPNNEALLAACCSEVELPTPSRISGLNEPMACRASLFEFRRLLRLDPLQMHLARQRKVSC